MKIEWRNCFKVGLSIFLLYLCIFYWQYISGVLASLVSALAPVATGLAIAYVLNILMSFFERHYFTKFSEKPIVKKSRTIVCMLASVISLCAIIALIVRLVVPELVSCIAFIASQIPPFFDRVIDEFIQNEFVMDVLPKEFLADISDINWQDLIEKVLKFLVSGIGFAAETIISVITSLISGLISIFVSIIFSIYFLLSRDKLINQSKRFVHSYFSRFEAKIMYVCRVFNKCFHKYIVGQCLEAVILWLLCTAGMMIFGFPYAQMISAFIGFTALIPVAGAYIGAAVGAVMILTVSPLKALLFIVFIVVLQQLEGNLIYPRVVGNSIGLPAVWVLASITVGGSLMGIMGMLIGVPIVAAIYTIVKNDVTKREQKELELKAAAQKQSKKTT